ncbi:peptide N-acetyl-beta-D-glucosaminyl asparaginase amidase A-domain-containing protein [Pholiota molesta]|nr:peptide N-acetyl-beta-D-glucosaminyl asparaginase amidase A-domain-containing protein [Pholiota molesta]
MRLHNLVSSLLGVLFAGVATATVLVDFQVAQPPPVPKNAKQCTIQVLQRDFAFSFGLAEVVQLQPPTDCGPVGSWSAITLNFTVTSNGTQFDRLGIFTFQNVEIWRTSTPEPTQGDGIIWTYIKDVTRYTPLFAKPGTFILQLDNLIETGLDGIYSTVLHATFFASSPAHPPAPKADLIVPISSLLNNTGNDVSVPPTFSLNVTLPQNTVKVFAELYASGNGNEEFWYFNTANEFVPDLPGFLGQGPFREVRLSVDGKVAGVAYPYATIFTGGIIPTVWRPITSYGALDLPTYFVDVTTFVPLLTDGKPHNFSLDVTSAEDDHTILQNWFLSAALQVFLDKSSKPTTGKMTLYSADPFSETTTTGSVGNGDVNITVAATRKLHIESTVISGSGEVNHVVFTQDLQYKNVQNILNNTQIQNVLQTSSGSVLSTHNGVSVVVDQFSYPLGINITNLDSSGDSFTSTFDHSYNRDLLPLPIIPRSQIAERQTATGFFFISSQGNTGNGTNNNVFSYVDAAGNTFFRTVNAALNNITFDQQSGTLAPTSPPHFPFAKVTGPLVKPRLPNGRVIPGA